MKLTRALLLLLFPVMTDLLVACCDCDDPKTYKYTIDNIQLSSIDNSGSSPVEITDGTVPANAFGLRVRLPTRVIACKSTTNQPLFMQAAYARSCGCPPSFAYLPKDSIISIKIFTTNIFDGSHDSNSEVSDYFKINKRYTFIPIAKYIGIGAPVFYESGENPIDIDLLLMTSPTIGEVHQFRVEITLSDNRILSENTSNITLI